ncbi:MAG: pitrilysin family protein [Bacteroidia bacterium]
MKKNLKSVCGLVVLFTIGVANYVNAQTQFIEKVEARPDGLSIPYEKYKLQNGLTIMIHEDHSDPIVNVQVMYKVGSNRESIGKSGFAHFFEHMMFQGSNHVKDEEHFQLVNMAGGDMNGFTTRDRTVYYETLPSNQLELALWLEADRMGFLLDSLTSKKFENQRDAVKNEKGQGDNQPYGLLQELKDQTLYPLKHPYNWPVIGFTDDLNRASLEDVKNFFLRWYGPNNAILNVSGDVNPKEVVKLVEKYFGSIQAGPEVKKMKVAPVVLPADKYTSYKDNIYLPLNYRVYPTVPQYHRDEAALELLADMMGDGNNSQFYKNFVKSKLAIQAGVGYESSELGGEISIFILAYPPEDFNFPKMFNETDTKVKATIDEFDKTGITEEALQRAKAKKESSIIDKTSSVFSKSYELAEWERLLGKPFNLSDELDRYNKVTTADISRVLNKYIKGAGAAVVDVYPKMGSKDTVKSFNPYATMQLGPDPEYANLKYNKPVDNFDRSKKPGAGPATTPKVPEFYTRNLKNGIRVLGTMEAETPKVVIYMELAGGDLVLKPEEYKKMGIASLTADIMNEGTQNYTTEQFSAELEKLGSNISFYGGKESTTIIVETQKKNLDATLKLFEEKLLRPRFDAEDFKRVKKQYKEQLKDEKTNPNVLASHAYNSILYGNSPFGIFPNVKNVDKLELEDVKSYYNNYYSPSVATLTVVGNISENEIAPKLEFLEKWAAKEVVIKPVVPNTPVEGTQLFIVNKDFAPQSIIMIGHPSIPFDATGDYFKNTIVNYPFGGAFNSRINLNLREDKGYTYGISSRFSGSLYNGTFTINTSVKRGATAVSLKEILKETKKYMEGGVTDEEINFTKSSILNSEALDYETSYQKALFLNKIGRYKLDKDFTVQQANLLKNMTKEEFNQQIKKAYKSNLAVVVVGDKDIIKGQLDKLLNSKDQNETLKFSKVKDFTFD